VPHRLVMTKQVRNWLHALRTGDPVTRRLVAQAIDQLLDDGPQLARPLVDRIAGSLDGTSGIARRFQWPRHFMSSI
jgi:hypothetical protein